MRLVSKLGLVASFFGWNVWNVWAFFSSPLRLIGSVELHPPFLLLLACVTIPATAAISVALFWEQIRAMSPRNRFNGLDDELRGAGDTIGFAVQYSTPFTDSPDVLTVRRKLNRLGIPTPPLDAPHWTWLHFLAHVRSLAQTKDLKLARRLEKKR